MKHAQGMSKAEEIRNMLRKRGYSDKAIEEIMKWYVS
jgi:predicted Ser/Thr protein kinase